MNLGHKSFKLAFNQAKKHCALLKETAALAVKMLQRFILLNVKDH